MLPHALIHALSEQMVSESNGLSLAASNHQWRQVASHMLNLHKMELQMLAALEELNEPKGGDPPITGVEELREAFNMPKPKKEEPKKPTGKVGTEPPKP